MYQAQDQNDEARFVIEEILRIQREQRGRADIAVLYRTNYQSRVLEEELLRNGLPYKLVGGFRFYERKEVKDILSYMRTFYNLKDDLSLSRIINTPTRKMGSKSVETLYNIAKRCHLSVMQMIVGAYVLTNETED